MQIQQEVAKNFRLSREQLLCRSRNRKYSYPRMLAMYLVRRLTQHSFPVIAEQFGGVHHTSVMHACQWAVSSDVALEEYQAYIKGMLQKFGEENALVR